MTRPTIYPIEMALRVAVRRKEGWTWEKVRTTFGIEAPTARNLLAHYGLADEYKPPVEDVWSRPCLRCGSTEKRRRWLFRCTVCRRSGSEDFNAQDSMYVGSEMGT